MSRVYYGVWGWLNVVQALKEQIELSVLKEISIWLAYRQCQPARDHIFGGLPNITCIMVEAWVLENLPWLPCLALPRSWTAPQAGNQRRQQTTVHVTLIRSWNVAGLITMHHSKVVNWSHVQSCEVWGVGWWWGREGNRMTVGWVMEWRVGGEEHGSSQFFAANVEGKNMEQWASKNN